MSSDLRFRIEQRTTQPLLKAERPYEDFCLGWLNVLREGGLWHMWYAALDHNYKDDRDSYLCYARSTDGLHWERPDLGLFEYAGSRDNNILLNGADIGGLHGHHVFRDEQAPPEQRYKMAFVSCNMKGDRGSNRGKPRLETSPNPDESGGAPKRDGSRLGTPLGTPIEPAAWWVYGGVSADGLRWRILPEPLLKHNSDTQQAIIREPDRYRLYVRMWTVEPYGGYRLVGYTESKTFGDFPRPSVILAPDPRDPKDLHFYNSAATKLADGLVPSEVEGLYVMFPSAFYTGDGTVRPHLAVSRDGRNFQRAGREGTPIPTNREGPPNATVRVWGPHWGPPLLEPGAGFDDKGLYVAPGAIPGPRPGSWWFYYVGTRTKHDDNVPKNVRYEGGYGRFLLALER